MLFYFFAFHRFNNLKDFENYIGPGSWPFSLLMSFIIGFSELCINSWLGDETIANKIL